MSKPILKAQVISFRKEGKSYSQIKKLVKVSKSTLTRWLKELPLNREQLDKLSYHNQVRIEKYRQTRLRNKENKMSIIHEEEKKNLLPLNNREVYIGGLFLYWGEGGKTGSSVVISNTDPRVIKYFVYWLEECLGVQKSDLRVKMHLYQDMKEEEIIDYWKNLLGLEKNQFKKSYIKSSTLSGLTRKSFGHGTCNIEVGNVKLKNKIMMGIKAIADHYASVAQW